MISLHILGCGSALPTLRHASSAQVVEVRGKCFLVDCAEGTQVQLRRARLHFMKLSAVFISHLHGDHCFGLPGLLSTMQLHGRTGPVTIHCFEPGARLFRQMTDYFLQGAGFEIRFNVITTRSALVYEDDAITVRTFPLRHRVPAVGFLFSEKPKLRHIIGEAVQYHNVPRHFIQSLRQGSDYTTPEGTVIPNAALTTAPDPCLSYAYCSDTARSARVVKAVTGASWLYHEATYGDECAHLAAQRFHSTARQAGEVARLAGVQGLVLGHFSKRYTDCTPLQAQAREEFANGPVVLANEGLCLDLTRTAECY